MGARGRGAAGRRLIAVAAVAVAALLAWVAPASANNYTPSGTIVADSNFRPDANGYSFPNYGNEGNPQNLDVNGMQKIFGSAVCVGGGSGDGCTLTPAARAWKEKQNAGMGGGHCEGFAITSSFFYAGVGDPSTPTPFGADTVPALSLNGNSALQAHIAYAFVLQFLPSLSTTKVNGSPTDVVAALSAGLPSHEPMVLGVYQRGFKGGHAITPLAIEDRGEGQIAILVYDNNFPNTVRAVNVDTNANTWNYTASTNPSESASLYEGDAESKTLEVEYARNGLGTQPCPFCGGEGAKARADGEPSAQLLWDGDPRDGQHSEVSIVDDDGNTAGCSGTGEDRECVSEIPGVELIAPKAGGDEGGGDEGGTDTGVDVWNQSAPPVFDLPETLKFAVELDASDLEDKADEGFSVVRGGVTVSLDDLRLEEGDEQQVEVDGNGLAMENGSDHSVSPTLSYGDVAGGDGYEVTVRTSGLDEDSTLDLTAKPGQRRLKLDFEAGEDDDAKVTTVVTRTDADGDEKKAKTKPMTLDGGEDGTLSYSDKAIRDGKLELKV